MQSRPHILLSSVLLLACKFDASGLGEAATGPSSGGTSSASAGPTATESPGTTQGPATHGGTGTGADTGSGTGGWSTGVDPSTGVEPATTEPPANCGDGVLDRGETCDDGAENGPTRPCTPDCAVNVCGDGHPLTPGEACDDGNLVDGDTCRPDCTLPPTCGNNKVDNGEACDDGNAIDSDGCIACKKAVCGDGHVQTNVESCDDGQESPTCNADCSVRACGDAKLNASAGETCDLGAKNGIYNSGCNGECSGPGKVCGDGIVSAPEEKCDTSVALANATCVDGCQAIMCSPNFANCDNQPASGCEVNTTDDDNHCGKCLTKCTNGKHCEGSVCTY